MVQPLRSRTNEPNAAILASLKPTESINNQIANLKISRPNIEQENGHVFRSKIPILKSRIGIDCGGGVGQQKSAVPCCKNTIPVKQQQVEKPQQVEKLQVVNEPKPKVENIDSESDCFLLSNYAPDIYKYLHQLEKSLALEKNFLSIHNVVTPNMRAVLVNWINGIHRNFRLMPETFYLTISIIDRVLARESVEKSQLQLLGATAIFVAAKYEEIFYPDIKDIVAICDNLYTKHEILLMEIRILKVTNFELSGPSPLYFLRRGSKAAQVHSRVHMMGKFLCELSVIDYQCAQWLPSLVAATSLYVALKLNNDENSVSNGQKPADLSETSIWTPTIEHYTGYSIHDVRKYAGNLCRLLISSENSKHQNCRKKYSSAKCLNISNLSPNSMRIIKKMAI
ncbi:cyclin B [Dermatophagoides pteronyssinus]|uniref:cyclin B n=1 Tax=Dermatophagoides pteronyssinus TaxID=6956 RepID=UPI003F66736A